MKLLEKTTDQTLQDICVNYFLGQFTSAKSIMEPNQLGYNNFEAFALNKMKRHSTESKNNCKVFIQHNINIPNIAIT